MSLTTLRARGGPWRGQEVTAVQCECCRRKVEYAPRTWARIKLGNPRGSSDYRQHEELHFCARCWPVIADLLRENGAMK